MHPEQKTAIEHVRAYSLSRRSAAMELLSVLCSRSNVSPDLIPIVIGRIRERAQIALHFHPDRLDGSGQMVAAALLEQGQYRNQFQTHVSNGLLAPTRDGRRARWEDMFFGSAYSETDPGSRPKYGSLALIENPYGSSPSFGSCHLLLKPECLSMATFCHGDSSSAPEARGTIDTLEDILGALMRQSFMTEQVLGRANLRPPALLSHLRQASSDHSDALAETIVLRTFSSYIEAQVHDSIDLQQHGAALVADPSFRGTIVGDTMVALGAKYDLSLRWHEGLQLDVNAVRDDFRGNQMSSTAQKIAENGRIHTELIGRAANDAVLHPENWADSHMPASKRLKYLWHVLLRFGSALDVPA